MMIMIRKNPIAIVLLVIVSSIFLCSTCKKTNNLVDCVSVDTAMVLINISDLSKTQIADVIDFLADKELKLIAINLYFEESGEGDSILDTAIKKYKDRIVVNCDQEGYTVEINPYYKHVEYGPTIFYENQNDEVTHFSFLYESSEGSFIETFLLKILKKVRPELYSQVKNDTSVYPVIYQGNKRCFLNVNHSDLNNTIDNIWQGKIVLLGHLGVSNNYIVSTSDDIDVFRISKFKHWRDDDLDMYGTVIVANILSSLLNEK